MRIDTARREAEGITSYDLVSPAGAVLPPWTPGDHIDVHLPSGTIRQYSLCGDPADLHRWRIAVLELPQGRGGSVEAHRALRPGVTIAVGGPRDEFGLAGGHQHLFVAGGIGITPLLPMIREAEGRGAEWTLVYGARSFDHFAFVKELDGYRGRVRIVPQDTEGLIDVAAVLAAHPRAAVHCCGPAPLLDAIVDEMSRCGRADDLHLERFSPSAVPMHHTESFEVELALSGEVVTVEPDVSILDALRSAGIDHPSSCEMGICGTCEVKVLMGDVDHRDDLLTEIEKALGASMMICVSRARSARLVLNL